jgi:ribosomal protein S18 acetylase RimI-like enzyme
MADYAYQFTSAIPVEALAALFAQADWTAKRTPDNLRALLENTRVCMGVWDGGRLIGFGRAITDDLTRAYIEDVIVDEAYRGRGVGAEITRRLLARLAHVEEITLNCHDYLIPFYERLGFERAGMAYLHIWKGG